MVCFHMCICSPLTAYPRKRLIIVVIITNRIFDLKWRNVGDETLMRSPKIWRRRYSIANNKRNFTGIRLCSICLSTRYWRTTKTNFGSIIFEEKSMHKFPLRLLVLLSCLIYSWQHAAMGISSLLHRKRRLPERRNRHHCRRRCPVSFVFIWQNFSLYLLFICEFW